MGVSGEPGLEEVGQPVMAPHKPQFCQVLLSSRTCHGSPRLLEESLSSLLGLSEPLGLAWACLAWSSGWGVQRKKYKAGENVVILSLTDSVGFQWGPDGIQENVMSSFILIFLVM